MSSTASMLGVVNLDKPVGPTSHDMIGLLRRLTGIRRIGHAGTLDPLASGVLPVLVGAATRFSAELTGGRKRYEAVVRLGERSETDDAEGPITPVDGEIPDDAAIAAGLDRFVGTFVQRPPSYSARKVAGRRAYRAARAGEVLEVAPRTVTVEALELLAIDRHDGVVDVSVDLRCGAGTYVRSIARDLGEQLATGGHLRSLRRTEAGGLRIADALTPDDLQDLADQGRLHEALGPVAPLLNLPIVELGADAAWRFAHGAVQTLGEAHADGRVTVLVEGRLVGIGAIAAGKLAPERVLPLAAET